MKRMIFTMTALSLFFLTSCQKETFYILGTIFDEDEDEQWIDLSSEGDTFTFHSSNGGFDYFSISYIYGRQIDFVWSEFGNPDDYWVTVVASGADDSGRYTELSVSVEANASQNERYATIQVCRDSEMIFDRLSISQSGTEESPT